MRDRPGRRGAPLLAALALVACCALPVLLTAGGGAAAVVVGDLLRYWPLVVVGIAAIGWGVFRFAALRRSRQRERSDDPRQQGPRSPS